MENGGGRKMEPGANWKDCLYSSGSSLLLSMT
jgi:hypothetical protein